MNRRKALISTALVSLCLSFPSIASACPNCREAVANQTSPEAEGLRNGYFYSILFMISVPFSLSTIGFLAIRRAAKLGRLPEL